MRALLNRREFLGTGVGTALTMYTGRSRAQNRIVAARWSYLEPGFTVLLVKYMVAKKLAEATGAMMAAPQQYTTVSTYYNDFAIGNYDICMGSWDVFAQRYQAGVPIKLLCTISTADMISIVTSEKSIGSVADLRGKTLAAPQSTGTFRIVGALVKESYGLKVGSDIDVLGTDNPASSMTLAMANRADAGLSWEPNVTSGMARQPDLRVIFNAGQAYRNIASGSELPYFAFAVRAEWAEKNPEQVVKVRDVVSRCINGIVEDPEEALRIVGDSAGFPASVLLEALKSKRLSFRFGSMTLADERQNVIKAGEFMKRNGLLNKSVDQDFFVSS